MTTGPILEARDLTFAYGGRQALCGIGFTVERGATLAFLGPNGSGKSTLFKLLATLLPVQGGELALLGCDLRRDVARLRPRIGVVFQSPAVDRKLTVRRNLLYGGAMFGLGGADLARRSDELLAQTGLADRAHDRVETLSGGLRRRVELAKVLLHRPEVLLLDEPSTGLDPSARRDLWQILRGIEGLTVLFTTHLLDEAERAERVLILDQGRIVADGPPRALADSLGGSVLNVEIATGDLAAAAAALQAEVGLAFQVVEGGLRAQVADPGRATQRVVATLGARLRRLTLAPPNLEDVFFARTGSVFATREDA